MSNLRKIQFLDSPNFDSFGRLRVSTPQYVFDAQLTYGLQPLLLEPITNGSGAAVAHDATNRCALMTFASTPTGGKAYLQTYEHFRYQPGRSHLAVVTFNFIEAVANTLKFAGLSDGVNGVEFQLSGTTKQLVVYSGSANGNQTVTQANWNLDKLDGTGASGLTLDITKTQILLIDLQALYVGRVRVGFNIGGRVVGVHEFLHANVVATPYIQSANLPVRVGMTCTGTVSTTMRGICMSVASEGGQLDEIGFHFGQEGTVTAGSETRTHCLSLRPKTTFNSIANRTKVILEGMDIIGGANGVTWELCLGQAISGTTAFNDVNTTYSAMEYNTAGTISGSPAVVLAKGYLASASTANRGFLTKSVNLRSPLTLDAAGAVRALGTLSLLLSGIGGTSASRVSLNWREIR